MKTIILGKVLEVKSKDWEFDGKEGIAYSAKIFDVEDKEVRRLKINNEQAMDLISLVDTENVIEFDCSTFAEKLSLKVKEYEKKENN